METKVNYFLIVVSNVTSRILIDILHIIGGTPLLHYKVTSFLFFVNKVLSRRLQYSVGFTHMNSLHPVVTNEHDNKQLYNIPKITLVNNSCKQHKTAFLMTSERSRILFFYRLVVRRVFMINMAISQSHQISYFL